MAIFYAKRGLDSRVIRYPEEGVVGWFDSLVVPKGAKNIESAKKFMNFLLAPENMAMLSNYASYANAVPDSREFLSETLQNAQATTVPDGVPVVFGAACNETAQKLVDRVWTRVLQ